MICAAIKNSQRFLDHFSFSPPFSQTISEAKKALGYRPHYPIIIVPGLASSALEAWETDKGKREE